MKRKVVIGGIVLVVVVLLGGSVLARSGGNNGGTPTPTAPTASAPAVVSARGSVVPVQYGKLSFKGGGRVAEVPVQVGQAVKAGDVLARLGTADLELQVQAAKDGLALNEALLAQLVAPAGTDDLAAADAAYASAKAKYDELRVKWGAGGTASKTAEAEVRAAESAVANARANLAEAEKRLTRVEQGIPAEERRGLELALEQAKNSLWAAQIDRDGICGNQMFPEYQCNAANARVAAAETAVSAAKADLDAKLAPPTEEDKRSASSAAESARLALQAAEVKLAQAKEGANTADLKAAESNMAAAKATLDVKKNGPAGADITVAERRVAQARTAVAQAELALREATLVAPFDGFVAACALRPGEFAAPGAPAVTVADASRFQVETSDLDEASATKIRLGQPVTITVNAFDDKVLKGKIAAIAPLATVTSSGDANYTVVVDLDQPDDTLRWGMTAKVEAEALP